MKKKEYKAPEVLVELFAVESNILSASNPEEIRIYEEQEGDEEETYLIKNGFID